MTPWHDLWKNYFLQKFNTTQQCKAHLGAVIFLNLNRIFQFILIINALAYTSYLSSKDPKWFTKEPQKSPVKRVSTIIFIYKYWGTKAKEMLRNFGHEARRARSRDRT